MTTALKVLQADPSAEFEAAFCRVVGVFDKEAETMPKKLYTTAEIQELFSYLYDLRMKKVPN